MPAFGSNSITVAFAVAVLDRQGVVSGDGSEENPFVYEKIGFRLSDRIVSALDRFVGALAGRFASAAKPGLSRWLFLYPFVGGTDWTHGLNLADVGGGFTRFTILWAGSVTHNDNGITCATGGSGNTGVQAGMNDGEQWVYKSFGFYSRTQSAVALWDMLAAEVEGSYTFYQGVLSRHANGQAYCYNVYYVGTVGAGNSIAIANGSSLGLFCGSRTSSTDHRLYRNGVQLGATDTTSAVGFGTGTGGGPVLLLPSRNLAFAFSTKGGTTSSNGALSVAENAAFYSIVQQFQVGLGRAV